jgi:uncharacterized membrane protein YphA (DoxX/SURF4 family)
MPAQLQFLYTPMHLVGRILFSLIFIISGIQHITKLDAMTAYAQSKGLPAPKAAVALSGVLILVGGALVLIGWTRFIGVGLLFLFLIPTAFLMHPFWKETDPVARQNEMAHFLKVIALAGAALFIAYYGGTWWPLSLGG